MPIPEGFVKEAGLIFDHTFFSDVPRYNIPDPLISNLNQTPSNMYQLGK